MAGKAFGHLAGASPGFALENRQKTNKQINDKQTKPVIWRFRVPGHVLASVLFTVRNEFLLRALSIIKQKDTHYDAKQNTNNTAIDGRILYDRRTVAGGCIRR